MKTFILSIFLVSALSVKADTLDYCVIQLNKDTVYSKNELMQNQQKQEILELFQVDSTDEFWVQLYTDWMGQVGTIFSIKDEDGKIFKLHQLSLDLPSYNCKSLYSIEI